MNSSSFIVFLIIIFHSLPTFIFATEQKPALILLKSYQSQKNIDVKDWLMSEKLDGVRAYWDGDALYSRNGNKFAVPDWFIKDFPNFELDGELWTKRNDFSKIMSIVSQHKPHKGWHNISYQIFEVPNAQGNFPQRLNKIKDYLQEHPSSMIKLIAQYPCQGESHLQTFLADIEQQGGEGIVIRNPEILYHTGRSYSSLKVKTAQDAECKVIGYKEGKGQFKGLTGALFCQLDDQRIITIGSGLNHQERAVPPTIGSVITYRHNGYTSKGKPRFPVFLRIRKKL